MKTAFLTSAGILFLALATVGLLIPVLPTTPFVLVSAACFSSSPRLKRQIMRIAFFKEHIVNYKTRQGLCAKTIYISLIYLWAMMIISLLIIKTTWITILLVAIGVCVTIHILCMSAPKRK